MLSTPQTICLSAEAMQHMPQRGKGPIETIRENAINNLRNMMVTRIFVVKFLSGQLECTGRSVGQSPTEQNRDAWCI